MELHSRKFVEGKVSVPEDEISRIHCVSLQGMTMAASYTSRDITRQVDGNGRRERKRVEEVCQAAGNRVWDAPELPCTVLCIPNAYRAIPMHRMHGQLIYSRNKPLSFSINRKSSGV